jgi:arylsulfatase A-like enzyme
MGKRHGNIGRREFIQASGAAALTAGCLSAGAQRAGDTDRGSAAEKPNILFIIPDHQAFYGHDREGEFEYKWPRFEEFCSQGVRFDRAYSVCPLCTPARASMMTGLYPSAHGLIRNTDYEQVHDFRAGQRFYSHYLSEAGYRNAYVGKWHCGKDKVPVDFGIEGWALPDYGKVYMSGAYKEYAAKRGLGDARARIDYHLEHPEWNGTTVTLHHKSPWRFMNGSGVLVGPPAAHEEDFVAHLAIEKLKELAQSSRPWSLVASFWGPHHAFYPTEPYASMVDPATIPEYPTFRDDLKGRPLRHIRHREEHHRSSYAWPEWSTWQRILARAYGQGYQTDAAIGRILTALDELGLAENTVVIWCADHGDAVACHGGLWDKACTYIEEVARVPMAVRWPRRFKGGERTDKLVSNMDVTATILEAAGLGVPRDMHSRSLLALCRDPQGAEWRDYLVSEHHGHGGDNVVQRILVGHRYKYVAALYEGDELYDLQEDPFEVNNLVDAATHKDVKARMRNLILEHLDRMEDERPQASGEAVLAEERLAVELRSGR